MIVYEKRRKNNDMHDRKELNTFFSPSLWVNFHAITNRKYATDSFAG